VTYWQVRHVIRSGYVSVRQPPDHRKLYLTPQEARAIKAFFGVADSREVGNEEEVEARGRQERTSKDLFFK